MIYKIFVAFVCISLAGVCFVSFANSDSAGVCSITPEIQRQRMILIRMQCKEPEKSTCANSYDFNCWDCRDAHLLGVDLCGADLRATNFSGAYLNGANLSGADLRKAKLDGAYLPGANLSGADLREANLDNAYLNGANLNGADLRKASLFGANLQAANFSNADLRKANLIDAYLLGADLSFSNLYGVIFKSNTYWKGAVMYKTIVDSALKKHLMSFGFQGRLLHTLDY